MIKIQLEKKNYSLVLKLKKKKNVSFRHCLSSLKIKQTNEQKKLHCIMY